MDILATPAVVSTLPPLATPAVQPATPNDLAAARFSALMQAPPAAATPTAQAAAAAVNSVNSANSANVAEPHSVGDRILSGMQGVSNDFQAAWKSVSASLDANASTMSMQDLLKLQLQLVQVSVQYDLVGKAVSKSTQNFDQLVRVQ